MLTTRKAKRSEFAATPPRRSAKPEKGDDEKKWHLQQYYSIYVSYTFIRSKRKIWLVAAPLYRRCLIALYTSNYWLKKYGALVGGWTKETNINKKYRVYRGECSVSFHFLYCSIFLYCVEKSLKGVTPKPGLNRFHLTNLWPKETMAITVQSGLTKFICNIL